MSFKHVRVLIAVVLALVVGLFSWLLSANSNPEPFLHSPYFGDQAWSQPAGELYKWDQFSHTFRKLPICKVALSGKSRGQTEYHSLKPGSGTGKCASHKLMFTAVVDPASPSDLARPDVEWYDPKVNFWLRQPQETLITQASLCDQKGHPWIAIDTSLGSSGGKLFSTANRRCQAAANRRLGVKPPGALAAVKASIDRFDLNNPTPSWREIAQTPNCDGYFWLRYCQTIPNDQPSPSVTH